MTRREQADPEEAEYEAAFGDIAGSGSTSSGPPRTKAELKFEEVKRQRVRLLFFALCRTLLGVRWHGIAQDVAEDVGYQC